MEVNANNETDYTVFNADCLPPDQSAYCRSNQTHVFIEEPLDMLDPFHINPAFLTIVVTHAITFFVGIVGNSVVIVTWARGGKLRSSTATFLVSLACADLLLLFIYVPLETLEYFVITWDSEGNICKLSSFVEMLSGMASVLNLVAVSVERFLVIVYPIRARRWCTVSKSRRSLLLVWTLALLLASPIVLNKHMYAITYYNNETSLTAYYCWESSDGWALFLSIYQLLVLFICPALLMCVCYCCVIRELWASTKVITSLTTPTTQQNNGMRVHKDGQSYLVRWPSKRHVNNTCLETSLPSLMTENIDFFELQSTQQTPPKHRSPAEDMRQTRKQVIKMLLFIVIIFHVCWGPRLIMNVIISTGLTSYDQITYSARVAFYLLSFIHSALNPFVYGFMSSNFRRMMVNSCHQLNGSALELAREERDHCSAERRRGRGRGPCGGNGGGLVGLVGVVAVERHSIEVPMTLNSVNNNNIRQQKAIPVSQHSF